MHATWNLLAKRVSAGTPFLFLVYVVGAVAYSPFAIAVLVIARPELGLITVAFVAMAIVLQTVYFGTLTAARPSPSATRSRLVWSSRCTRSGTRRPCQIGRASCRERV